MSQRSPSFARVIGRSVLGLAAAGSLCAAAQAMAQQDARPAQASISEMQAAELLYQAGKLPEAKRVLLDLQAKGQPDSEVLFLLGMIAVDGDKDYPAAIRLFRRILVREPKAVRVRLELGRAFFLKKDYANADREFRLALAGDLPAGVTANINTYLLAIRNQRNWSFNFAVAAAPDTNLNAGPSSETVDIFGLPFQLSDETRRKSGIGLAVDAGGEWAPRISPGLRMAFGGQIHTLDYGQSQFDDTTLSGYSGPQIVAGRWDAGLLATYYRRWYGGSVYNEGAGGSLQASYHASPRFIVSGGLTGQYIDYRSPPEQSGPAASISLGDVYTLTSTSFISEQVSAARQWAAFSGYANTTVQLQLGYYRELPRGYSIQIQPSWARTAYDAPLAAFGVSRIDRLLNLQTTLLNRRLDFAGFTPKLVLTLTRNSSNIPLYTFNRNRLEIGVTRLF